MNNNWTYTTIQHGPRLELGLSINAYCVLDVIYKSQTHPRYGQGGWATIGVRKLASFFGLSVGGIHRILTEAEEGGLLEVDPENRNRKRTTQAFYDAILEGDPVQKVNASVQKVNAYVSESEHIKERKQKKEYKGKSEDLPDLFEKLPDLKEQIGPKHHQLLNEVCQKGAKAGDTYKTLKSIYTDGRFDSLIEWLTYKKEIRKGYRSASGVRKLVYQFAEFTTREIRTAVNLSISNAYDGVFPKRIPDAKMKPIFPNAQRKAL